MSFWGSQEDKVPEAMRGKKPEEIAAMIQAGAAAQTELTQLKQEQVTRDAAMTNMQTELAQAKAALARLEAGNGNGNGNANPNEPAKLTSFIDNEDRAFAERAQPLVTAVVHQQGMTAKLIAMEQIKASDDLLPVYKKYQSECEEWFKRLTPQQAAIPDQYLACIRIVAGSHIKEIAMADPKDSLFAAPGASGAQPPTAEGKGGSDRPLSEEELHVARQMGISDDDYKKARAEVMVHPGGTVGIPK